MGQGLQRLQLDGDEVRFPGYGHIQYGSYQALAAKHVMIPNAELQTELRDYSLNAPELVVIDGRILRSHSCAGSRTSVLDAVLLLVRFTTCTRLLMLAYGAAGFFSRSAP